MNTFDMRTATLLVAVLYTVMPAFAWIVLGERRNRAAALWCGGGLLMGFGTILVSVFTGGNDFLSLSLPVFFNTVSFLVRTQALRMDLGKPYRALRLVLVLVLSTAVYEYLLHGIGLYVPRASYASLVFCVGGGMLAYHALQIARAEGSATARWIALAYGGAAAAFFVRILYLSQQDMARVDGNIVTDGIASVAVAVLMLLSSVIGHFGYVGLALERTQRESIRRAQEQARQEVGQQLGAQIAVLERRRSLGELAASIGHELNQPLTAILTNTQLAMRGLRSGRIQHDAAVGLLEKVEQNTQRAAKILERIRDFMRAKVAEQEIVDLHKVIADVVDLMEGDVRNRAVRIEIALVQGPVLVRGDALQLSQILLNLLRNAMESMAQQPEHRMRITCREEAGRAMLTVRDWGVGLREEHLDQIGSPFFSTKVHGLGMGFAISRTIARDHGGNLTLSNAQDEDGTGAIAMLDLPLAYQGEQS